jgi:hypothetical protein
MKKYGLITGIVVALWFALAVSAAASGWLQNTTAQIGLPVALFAGVPLLLFALALVAPGFRGFVLAADLRFLTFAQAWRIIGFTFVLLQARDLLPAVFAWPAGYGDMAIGFTAPIVALLLARPERARGFILWQALGMLDLVTAVSLGVTARLLVSAGPTMLPLTVLPLSLVPTFLVPLFLMLHVISVVKAAGWLGAEKPRAVSLQAA